MIYAKNRIVWPLWLGVLLLTGCNTISKTDCLNADWHKLGYELGVKGDTNKVDNFDSIKKVCDLHGSKPGWEQYQQGHSDGIVQFCQLSNAVELGVSGAREVIDNRVCSYRDYPDFARAFEVGYKLYELKREVQTNNQTVVEFNRQKSRGIGGLRRNNSSIPGGIDSLLNRGGALDRKIEQSKRLLSQSQLQVREYSDYVYEDYLPSLSKQFVDPRKTQNGGEKPRQSEFDDKIDELLSQ